MKNSKSIKEQFSTFFYFYSFLKNRTFVLVLLSILMSFLDGLGLSMFLPLLTSVADGGESTATSSGNMQKIFDLFVNIGIPLTLINTVIILSVFFVFKGVISFVLHYYQVIVQQFFIRRVRIDLVRKLKNINFKAYVSSDVGRIQNVLTGEIERLSKAQHGYFKSMEQFILVVCYMLFAFFVDYKFAFLVAVGGGLSNVLYKSIYKRTKQASRGLAKHANTFQGQVMQFSGNFKYLKATDGIEAFSKKLETQARIIEKNQKLIGKLVSILSGSREPILIVVICMVILIHVKILGGSMTSILISLVFFYRALSYLMLMQNNWNIFLSNIGSLENIQNQGNIFDEHKEDQGEIVLSDFNNSILVENLHFSYGDVEILKGINLTIKRNTTVAFVGESGCGKTTLVNCIAGLLHPNLGEISIDGVPFSALNRSSLRKRIGYITQESVIFSDTIFNNVTFWEAKTPENIEKFWQVLKQTAMDVFVSALPDGEDTTLGNNGVNLSGGQRQRISIARELYRNIDILIMDEATSALDAESELHIQQSIDDLKGKLTLLIVAHRLSTVKSADSIVMMEKGMIANTGNFAELVNTSGSFNRLVTLQQLG